MQQWRKIIVCTIGVACSWPACSRAQSPAFSLDDAGSRLPHLAGEKKNAAYSCVTAGDQLYAIDNQAGAFPATGFHVQGEMGGIWQHPVKLLDGFSMTVADTQSGLKQTLKACDSFTAYPFLTKYTYDLAKADMRIQRTQFVPDGIPVLVVEYNFRNTGTTHRTVQAMLQPAVDMRPVWLGGRSGMADGKDEWLATDPASSTVIFKDDGLRWFTGISFGTTLMRFTDSSLVSTVRVPAGETVALRYYITGAGDTATLKENISRVVQHLPVLFQNKLERYRRLDSTAVLDVPDTLLMQAYRWGKYCTDWLVRDVPGLGRGLSAGLPDYPWFFSNDQAYTFNALTGIIDPELFYQSWHMLKTISDRANDHTGRIIHEASTNGAVYDKGRMEESQLHIITAWKIFKWTGNLDFLQENYAWGKKVLSWLLQHDKDQDGYIEGYGGVEIEGLNEEMLDVAVHTQRFYQVMSEMAAVLQEPAAARNYHTRAATLRLKINKDWWMPQAHRYADFMAGRTKALEIIDHALAKRVRPGRNQWAREYLQTLRAQVQSSRYKDSAYVVYFNNAGFLPLKEGVADTVKAMELLQHIRFFTNRFGIYIAGIERPDDITADEGSMLARRSGTAFSYAGGAIMPVVTGSLVMAACRYGLPDTALQYMQAILRNFNYATPGTTYELSPDYGQFVQAWNVTGINIPVIQYFFGIDPEAWQQQIHIRPLFPSQWKYAGLRDLLIGNNKLSMRYQQEQGYATYKISLSAPGWKIYFQLPEAAAVWLNGKPVADAKGELLLQGLENTIRIKKR